MSNSLSHTVLVPLPKSVAPVTHIRSTWVTKSIERLDSKGYGERYRAVLPASYHSALFEAVAGAWMPIEHGMAHYAACDQLGMSPSDQFAMGYEVAGIFHRGYLSLALKLARAAGTTPWTVLEAFPTRLWPRAYCGGGVGIQKIGPKEAQVDIAGWPLAQFSYIRAANCGITQAMCEPFARKVEVRPHRWSGPRGELSFRVAWA